MFKSNKTNLLLLVASKLAASCRFVLFLVLLTGVILYTRAGAPERAQAAVPATLNFQARLLNSNGSIVADGYYNVEFKLYDASGGGNLMWTETWYDSNGVTAGNDNRIQVKNGYLSVYLGDQTAFGAIDWTQQYWLTMNIGGTTQTATPTWDGEMNPRLRLTSVPYAQAAAQAEDSNTLDGIDSGGFAQLAPGSVQGVNSANTALRINQTGAGNLLQLQSGGSDVLTLSNAGVLTVSGAANFNGGLTVASGQQLTNSGSTLLTAIAISDKPTGGAVGTAAATVDVASTLNVNQTTTGQTLTLPTPTSATAGRIIFVANVGTADFALHGVTISSTKAQSYIWNGSAWVSTSVDGAGSGATSVGTIDGTTKSANGGVISANQLFFQTADATYPGLVSTSGQTFAGDKTFNGQIIASGGIDMGTDTIQGTTAIINFTNFDVEADGDIITAGDLAVNGGDITSTGTLNISSAGSNALTIDSGTTGAVNVGTGANAKAVTIGNATSTSSLLLQSGTGDIALESQDNINIGTNAVAQDITIGNVTGATSLTLNSGTGAIAIGSGPQARIINIGVAAAAQTVTIGSTNTTSSLQLQSGTGDVAISSQDDINIGTNTVAQDITIGNQTGATSVTINGGSAGVAIQSVASSTINVGTNSLLTAVNIGSGNVTTTTVAASGTLSLQSGTIINMGTATANAVVVGSTTSAASLVLRSGTGDVAIESTDDINIGVNAVAQDITIGNGTGATSLTLQSGTGAINIGTNAVAHAITIGNATGATSVSIQSGTGAINIGTGAQARAINFGTGAAAQTITIGSTTGASSLALQSGTGNIDIGSTAQVRTINIGAAAAIQTVNIGSGILTSSLLLNAGTGDVTIQSQDDINIGTNAVAQDVVMGNTTGATSVTFNAGTGGIVLGTISAADNAAFLCRNSANQIASCNTTGTGAAFVQGGNSFGATAVLGTNDANDLQFETAGTTRLTLDQSGNGTLTGNLTVQGTGTSSFAGVLTVDGNTTLGNANTDTLTITGTAVTLPNSLNFDSDTLYIDAVNNRVGIGTNAPATVFHVSAANGVVATLETTGTSGNTYAMQAFKADGRQYRMGVASSTETSFGLANKFFLFDTTAVAVRLVVDTSGNLGLGDSSPDAKLEVLATSTSTTAGTLKGGELTVTDTGVVTTGTDTTYGQRLVITRTGATGGTLNTYGLDIQATGDSGGTSTLIGLNVNVSGADTNYAAIFQGGNVGIGDTTPAALFTVGSGDLFQVSSTGATTITSADSVTLAVANTLGSGAAATFTNSGTGTTATFNNSNGSSGRAATFTSNNVSSTVVISNSGVGNSFTVQSGATNVFQITNSPGAVGSALFKNVNNNATAFVVQTSGGASVLNVNTSTAGVSVGGTLAVSGDSTLSGSLVMSGVATDITTGANEDLTVVANGTGVIDLNDIVRVGTLGSTDTDAVLCRNAAGQLAACNSTFLTSANAFIQSGNSFSATAVLGTNDANALELETSGITRLTVSSGGNLTYAGLHTGTASFVSDLTAGARSTDLVSITQANDATNNSTGNLLELNNADTGSTAAVLNVVQGSTGAANAVTITSSSTTAALSIVSPAGGTGLAVTGVTNGTGISVSAAGGIGFTAPNITSGTAFSTGTAISSGTAFNFNASNIGLTSAKGFNANGVSSGALSAFSGILFNGSLDRTITGATTIDDTGNFLNLNRTVTNNGTGTVTVSGALATLQSTCGGTGTCTDTANILNLMQANTAATGTVLQATNAGTGFSFRVNDDGTTTDSTPFVIDNTGKVGVGVSAPLAGLHLNGNGLSDPLASGTMGQIYVTDNRTAAAGVGGVLKLGGSYTGTTTTPFGAIRGVKSNATDGNYDGQLEFFTRANGSSSWGTPQMVINAAGSVGIGDATPDALLDVAGTFQFDGNGVFGDASGDTLTINGTAVSTPNNLNFDSNTLFIDAANNSIGIGTTSPNAKLSLGSDVTAQKLLLFDSGNVRYGFGIQANELRMFTPNGTNHISFGTISSTDGSTFVENVRFEGDGNVGIGDTSPAAMLTVGNGDLFQVASDGAILSTTSKASGTGYSFDATNTAVNGALVDVQSSSTSQYAFRVTSGNGTVNGLSVRADGSVGMGTVSPDARLHIQGTADDEVLIVQGHSTQNANILEIKNSGGTVLASVTGSGILKVGTTSAPTLGTAKLLVTEAEITTRLRIGDATNGISFNDETSNQLRYRGTARNTKKINLIPEYFGAVLTGDGTNNTGTMTSDFCSGTSLKSINTSICAASDEHNYYSWTAQATNDYDIYIRYQLPSDFDGFASNTTIQMYGWRTTSTEKIELAVFNAAGTQCGSTTEINSSNNTWQTTSLTGSETSDSACNTTNMAPGSTIVFRVRMTVGTNNNFARAGAITFEYLSKF